MIEQVDYEEETELDGDAAAGKGAVEPKKGYVGEFPTVSRSDDLVHDMLTRLTTFNHVCL